jgi:hypothetical protein
VVEDNGPAGAQQLHKLRPYGLDRRGLALEILVLGIVDAVPAVEAMNPRRSFTPGFGIVLTVTVSGKSFTQTGPLLVRHRPEDADRDHPVADACSYRERPPCQTEFSRALGILRELDAQCGRRLIPIADSGEFIFSGYPFDGEILYMDPLASVFIPPEADSGSDALRANEVFSAT